jgi:hypothetical protein
MYKALEGVHDPAVLMVSSAEQTMSSAHATPFEKRRAAEIRDKWQAVLDALAVARGQEVGAHG